MGRTRRTASPRRRTAGFIALCAAYWAVAVLVASRVPAIERLGIDSTATGVAGLLAVFGQHAQRAADVLYVNGASVTIASDCSPHIAFLVFAAVVLAFPATWRERLAGLAMGLVLVCTFNLVRILALIQVMLWKPSWFEFAHVYLWQTGTVLVVIGTFGLWLRWLGRGRRAPAPAVAGNGPATAPR